VSHVHFCSHGNYGDDPCTKPCKAARRGQNLDREAYLCEACEAWALEALREHKRRGTNLYRTERGHDPDAW